MFSREELLRSPEYWFEGEQDELFRQFIEYMERENINKTELALRLKVSKGYVSQILNGNFNYTLKKLIEICLAIGIVPQIGYKTIENVIKEDAQIKASENLSLKKEQVGDYESIDIAPNNQTVKASKKALM